MTPTEQLREALNAALKTDTMYKVAKDSGLKWDTVRRFSEGDGLRSPQFDMLCAYLGLELTPVKRKR